VSAVSAAQSPSGPATKLLSWAIFLLMLFQMYMSTKVATTPRGTPARELLAQTHYSTGLVLLLLVSLRLVIWARTPRPARAAGVPAAADALAGHCNLAFYLTLLAFALSGPAQAWSEGHKVNWYGLFALPSLLGPSYRLQVAFGYLHSFMGFWILYLTAFALLVAIYQRLRYGAPLLRMLPGFAWSRPASTRATASHSQDTVRE
jgi:superoxide oxidase